MPKKNKEKRDLEMNGERKIATNLLNVKCDRKFDESFEIYSIQSHYKNLFPTGLEKIYEEEDHPCVKGLCLGKKNNKNVQHVNFYCLMPKRKMWSENSEAIKSALKGAKYFDYEKKEFVSVEADKVTVERVKSEKLSDKEFVSLLLTSLTACPAKDGDMFEVYYSDYSKLLVEPESKKTPKNVFFAAQLLVEEVNDVHPYDVEQYANMEHYRGKLRNLKPAYLNPSITTFTNRAGFINERVDYWKTYKSEEEVEELEKKVRKEFDKDGYWTLIDNYFQPLPIGRRFGEFVRLINKPANPYETAQQKAVPYIFTSSDQSNMGIDRLGVAEEALRQINEKYGEYGIRISFMEIDPSFYTTTYMSKTASENVKEFKRLIESISGKKIHILNAGHEGGTELEVAYMDVAKDLKQALEYAYWRANTNKGVSVKLPLSQLDSEIENLKKKGKMLDIEIKRVRSANLDQEINDEDIFIILIPDKNFYMRHPEKNDAHNRYPGKNVQHIAINLNDYDKAIQSKRKSKADHKVYSWPYGLKISSVTDKIREPIINGMNAISKIILIKMARREDIRKGRAVMEDVQKLNLDPDKPLTVWLAAHQVQKRGRKSPLKLKWYKMKLFSDGKIVFDDNHAEDLVGCFEQSKANSIVLNYGDT